MVKLKDLSPLKRKQTVRKYFFVYGLMAPGLICYLVFNLFNTVRGLIMPFQDSVTGAFSWENFELVGQLMSLGEKSPFVTNLRNTMIYYVTSILTQYVISLGFSYFLCKKILFQKFFQIMFMLPMIVSGVVFVSIYKNLLAIGGPVALLWEKIFNVEAPMFLYDPNTATWSIVAYCFWTSYGMQIILFAGAIARIPKTVIESAQIDGITFWGEFFKIVLPLIAPTVLTLFILGNVGIFSSSGPILLFSGGMYETSTIDYWLFETVVYNEQYNFASAIGMVLTLASIPIFFLTVYLKSKIPQDYTF